MAIKLTEKQNRKFSMYLGTLTISFRVYWDKPRHEMESLSTSWLVDEFQQNLHSKTDYASALTHILTVCPELGQYMTDYQLVLTGGYPTWKYSKKLVAEVIIIYFQEYIFYNHLQLISLFSPKRTQSTYIHNYFQISVI